MNIINQRQSYENMESNLNININKQEIRSYQNVHHVQVLNRTHFSIVKN